MGAAVQRHYPPRGVHHAIICAVVGQCAPIIRDCEPGGVVIIPESAPATGVVIAPSPLAYRAATLNLLRQRPEGLDVAQVDFELRLGKRGRESSTSTLQGMVDDGHLLEKQGNGETIRYVVAPSA